MSEHFLTEIDILQYKCFKDFSAKGFKRVNLLSGQNNVGKTAFLEASYLNVIAKGVSSMAFALYNIKYMRENINILTNSKIDNFHAFIKNTPALDIKSNINAISFQTTEIDQVLNYVFKIESNEFFIPLNNLALIPPINYNFIDNYGWSNFELTEAFNILQLNDKESELNSHIQTFDTTITAFKIIADKPHCRITDTETGETAYRELTECGDGLKHYIAIILAIHANTNGYLFIDELDNGIHYSQLDRLWRLIFTTSKQCNCQIFATTHSKEMLEAFARCAQQEQEQDISFTTLVKTAKGTIKAITQNFDLLNYSILEQGHEVR